MTGREYKRKKLIMLLTPSFTTITLRNTCSNIQRLHIFLQYIDLCLS